MIILKLNINIKQKRHGFILSLEDAFLEKQQWGQTDPPDFLGLNSVIFLILLLCVERACQD